MTIQNTSFQTWTTVETTVDRTQELDWIIPLVLHIALLLISLWLLVSLVHYGVKTNKWCRNHTNKSDKFSTGLVYTSAVACSVTCLVFIVLNMAYINIAFGYGQDELCDTISDIALAVYGILLFWVYLFLWFRQRVFYNSFLLNAEYSVVLRILSSSSIVLVAIAGTLTVIFNTLPNDTLSSPNGCIYMPNEDLKVGYWVSIVVVIVFGQAVLLGLFVYALKKTTGEKWSNVLCCFCGEPSEPPTPKHSRIKSISYSSSGESSHSNRTLSKSYSRENQPLIVRKILWKTLIFAFLSTLVDILVQIVIHYITAPKSNRRTSATVTSTTALLNLLFIILSFVSYRDICTSIWTSIRENWSEKGRQSSADVTNVF